eukprot:725884-Pleurochrysis_carterae.AAC.1
MNQIEKRLHEICMERKRRERISQKIRLLRDEYDNMMYNRTMYSTMSGLQQGPSNYDIHSHVSKSLEDMGLLTTLEEDMEADRERERGRDVERERERERELEMEREREREREREHEREEDREREIERKREREREHERELEEERQREIEREREKDPLDYDEADSDDTRDTTLSINDVMNDEQSKQLLTRLNNQVLRKIQRRTIAGFYNKTVSQLTAKDMLDYYTQRFPVN